MCHLSIKNANPSFMRSRNTQFTYTFTGNASWMFERRKWKDILHFCHVYIYIYRKLSYVPRRNMIPRNLSVVYGSLIWHTLCPYANLNVRNCLLRTLNILKCRSPGLCGVRTFCSLVWYPISHCMMGYKKPTMKKVDHNILKMSVMTTAIFFS